MRRLRSAGVPGVQHAAGQTAGSSDDGLAYYVMDFVEGRGLDAYVADVLAKCRGVAERRDAKRQIVEHLVRLGQSVVEAHLHGIVHRDIKPSNVVAGDDGTLSLVDFDSATRLIDGDDLDREVGTFGFSAPEVLAGEARHSVAADVFSLARVVMFVWSGGPLPDLYAADSDSLIDELDCGPALKTLLRRATASSPGARPATLQALLDDLDEALREEAEPGRIRDALRLVRQDRYRAFETLRHGFYGTLAVMVIARPLAVALRSWWPSWQPVYLSDRVFVAVFHGIVGSAVWSLLITAAFLAYAVVWHREDRQGALRAMLLCAVAGGLGGVLVSCAGVLVTNAATLVEFGWILPVTPDDAVSRLSAAMVQTRMFWSFPVTGLFTGAGLGLFLNQRVNELVARGAPGVLPVPIKRLRPNDNALGWSLAFVLRQPRTFVWLLLPVVAPVWIMLVLRPDLWSQPARLMASVGEGLVHAAGAVGLATGFFLGVARPPRP